MFYPSRPFWCELRASTEGRWFACYTLPDKKEQKWRLLNFVVEIWLYSEWAQCVFVSTSDSGCLHQHIFKYRVADLDIALIYVCSIRVLCRSLDLTGPLLLGGVPNLPEDFPVRNRDFVGCMRNLRIDSQPIDMASFIANNGTAEG